MTIKEFIDAYKAKRFMNTKQGVDERIEWIRNTLEVREYIPFMQKRQIAEMVVEQNIEVVDGIKKYDSINGYIGLMVASIMAHTSLEFSDNPVTDYDLLAESGLLMEILAEIEGSHQEIDLLLHMALDMELEDNEINAAVGRLLNKVSDMLDDVAEVAKDKLENFDLQNFFDIDIKKEDLVKLRGFLNKLK